MKDPIFEAMTYLACAQGLIAEGYPFAAEVHARAAAMLLNEICEDTLAQEEADRRGTNN